MSGLLQVLRSWRDVRRVQRLDPEARRVVFYSEGAAYWVFFKPVVDALTRRHGQSLCYLTSDPRDPLLRGNDPRILAFYIGDGAAQTYLFRSIEAGVMVMTMPDLHSLHLLRSLHPVHYVYLHHSMVSTHMIYRRGAFDHFDSVLCVGPHHEAETREWERLNGLPAKRLFRHGYGPLDALLDAATAHPGPAPADQGVRVLVAPSWGANGLLETCGAELVEILLAAGHQVSVRPHPQTRRRTPRVLDDLHGRFQERPGFALDEDTTSFGPLIRSHLMISDWSGVAMEFAFGLERPVLFVDVPRKVNNPEYTRLGAVPLEVAIREEIGAVLAPDRLSEAPAMIQSLWDTADSFAARARRMRETWIYNLGTSGIRGADAIAELARSRSGVCAE
ncbi:MAG: hypothetical protein ACE5JZ_00290 [Kiloniellales bacterium]